MTDQLSLDDLRGQVRSADPDTCRSAARRANRTAPRDRERVLEALLLAFPGGLTDFELGTWMGRKQTSAGKRRGELRDDGLVEDSGVRRPSDTGSAAVVWSLTESGYNFARAAS